MRNLVFAAMFAALSSTTALAEDYNWSGFYAGVQIGNGWTDSRYNAAWHGFQSHEEHALDGISIGLFGGMQKQFSNNIVVGVEVDAAWRDVAFESAGMDMEVSWNGSLRARLGYAAGRWMPYATGGISWSAYDLKISIYDKMLSGPDAPPRAFDLAKNDVAVGWSLGVGGEYALLENLFVRAEYRYSDFGEEDGTFTSTAYDGSPYILSGNYAHTSHDFLVGLSYRF